MFGSSSGTEESSAFADDLLSNAVLGGGLPEEALYHLHEAGLNYQQDQVAEEHLRQAEALAPGHAAVLIGLYRFYFYKNRLSECLQVANACLDVASRENQLARDWRLVEATDAEFSRYEELLPRFYLFTLKGYAYLQLRLGNLDEGHEAVLKLLTLDHTDKIGAKVLLEVVQRIGQDDDE